MAKLPDSVIQELQNKLDNIKAAQATLTQAELDEADKEGIAQAAADALASAQAVTNQASQGMDSAEATFLAYVEENLQPIQPA